MTETYSSHFSIRNIPFGIASSPEHPEPQAVTRVGDTVIFLQHLQDAGLLADDSLPDAVFSDSTLNRFAALPKSTHSLIRNRIQTAVDKDGTEFSNLPKTAMEHISQVTLHLPVAVSDFVDFSCSLEHVKNAGRIVIGDEKPPPAFFNLPIGYQGRASSIVVSGTNVVRPLGQYRGQAEEFDGCTKRIIYGPSQAVDYEMEFAAITGKPLPMNQRLRALDADEHIFGFVMLNDWSSRDIQGYEMIPLGPLIGKNFGTSISPWIVTTEALEPFKVRGQEPKVELPPYLRDRENTTWAVKLQAEIVTKNEAGSEISTLVGSSCVSNLYWSIRQMIAHVASAGAALRTGDVMATGTVTGATDKELGCLLEVTDGGKRPLELKDGSERRFLKDNDAVRITAVAGDGTSGVGFGECVGRLVPFNHLSE